jgi:hypothetical protein
MDNQNPAEYIAKELGIDSSKIKNLEAILDHYNIQKEPDEKQKVAIRWKEYCGTDVLLASLIQNLHNAMKYREEHERNDVFKFLAWELTYWWKHLFQLKDFIKIQPMTSPVGLVYYYTHKNETLHLEPETITANTQKLDGVWQDYVLKNLYRDIVETSNYQGDIQIDEFLEKFGSSKFMVSKDVSVESFSFTGNTKCPIFSKLENFFLDTHKKKYINHSLDRYDVIVMDENERNTGIIWCPYVLPMCITGLETQIKFKYMVRHATFKVPEPTNKYKRYTLVM